MVMAGHSVHLTTLEASLNSSSPVLRAHTFACNWQQPFLNDSAEGNICSQTRICCQTRYRLLHSLVVLCWYTAQCRDSWFLPISKRPLFYCFGNHYHQYVHHFRSILDLLSAVARYSIRLGIEGLLVRLSPVFCPWPRHFICCALLVQPRKTCPYMTEKLLTGM